MKSKNIPSDIREKSIKEAQTEIKEIIAKLESSETNLEESMQQYSRMIQLNNHIQNKFKQMAVDIKKTTLSKKNKTKSKN